MVNKYWNHSLHDWENGRIFPVFTSSTSILLSTLGTITFRHRGERITFDYLLMGKFLGEKSKVTLLRQGKVNNRIDISSIYIYLFPSFPYEGIDQRPSLWLLSMELGHGYHGGIKFPASPRSLTFLWSKAIVCITSSSSSSPSLFVLICS